MEIKKKKKKEGVADNSNINKPKQKKNKEGFNFYKEERFQKKFLVHLDKFFFCIIFFKNF